ncbi:MAG: FAD-dependent oxidoreductase [Halobacteria archaeon]
MEGQDVEVTKVEEVGTDTVALTIESPEGFEARPGQFVQVGIDTKEETVVRHYTISSKDVDRDFEITVEIDPEGELSPLLGEYGAGEGVTVDGPYGRSYLEDEDSATVLAGGPGIGPALGITEKVIENGGDVALVFLGGDPPHKDRLREIQDVGVVETVEDDGNLTDAVGNAVEEVDGQVFIYGFSEFVDSALESLEEAGYDGEAKIERFD